MNKKILLAILMLFCISTCLANNQINNTYQPINAISLDEEIIATELKKAQVICSETANTKTKKAFKNFNPGQYNNNPEYKVNNDITKFWYYSFLTAFNNTVKEHLEDKLKNNTLLPGEYARIAFEINLYANIFTRKHMRDTEKYDTPNSPSFEYLMAQQTEKQKIEFEKEHSGQPFEAKAIEDGGNFDLNKAYNAIVELSTSTTWSVDTFMNSVISLVSAW